MSVRVDSQSHPVPTSLSTCGVVVAAIVALSGCAAQTSSDAIESDSAESDLLRTQLYVPTPGTVWQIPICGTSSRTCIGAGATVHVRLWGGGGGGGSGLAEEGYGGSGGGGGGSGAFVTAYFRLPPGATSLLGEVGLGGTPGSLPSTLPSAGGDSWVRTCTQAICSAQAITSAGGGQTGEIAIQYYGGGAGGIPTYDPTYPYFDGLPGLGVGNVGDVGNYGTKCSGQDGGAGAPGILGFGAGGTGGHGGYHHMFPQCTKHGNNWGITPGQPGSPGRVEVRWE